jgi:hypothetical protein
MLITPITKMQEEVQEKKGFSLNVDYFRSSDAVIPIDATTSVITETKRKPGRPAKKTTKTMPDGSEMVPAYDTELSQTQTNEPYLNTYEETNNLLKGAIIEIDMLNSDIKQELNTIKQSKTLKGKYTYMSELTSTSGTLIGQKITAIREINNSITKSHDFDLKRTKELKLSTEDVSDDMRIMDMYNAFINTPVSANMTPTAILGPSIVDTTMPTPMNGLMMREIVDTQNGADYGYNQYLNNMTPEQNRMRMERNPNIKTVVCYNQETGQKWFDVVDVTTGASIPNMPRPDALLLEDTNVNLNSGVARNSNIDQTWTLLVMGRKNSVLDY